MKLKTLALSGLICVAAAPMAMAEIVIKDAYARSSGPMAKAGAAFMVIENTGDTADRLIAARADVAKRVELHTHIDDGNGVMKMREVEGGFAVPAGGAATLARGGDHRGRSVAAEALDIGRSAVDRVWQADHFDQWFAQGQNVGDSSGR